LVLIGLGASLEVLAQNPTGNTPLHAAVAGAAGESLAPLLVALGADARIAAPDGLTALHLAAARGFDALCRLLVARGAERSAVTDDGQTAADLARARGHAALALWLDIP
jgi:ankyrin repeat protein